jgi:hypothetical protein
MGGRAAEKLALIAAAWTLFRNPPTDSDWSPFSPTDLEDGGPLSLSYTDLDEQGRKLPDGQIALVDVADFGGIDCPPKAYREQRMPVAPSQREIEKLAKEELKRRALQP